MVEVQAVNGNVISSARPMSATQSMVGIAGDMAGADIKLGGSYIALYVTVGICFVLGVVLGIIFAKRAANK